MLGITRNYIHDYFIEKVQSVVHSKGLSARALDLKHIIVIWINI